MPSPCPTGPNAPTLAGFLQWVREIMAVPVSVLPDDAPIITYAYETALAVTNYWLACIPGPIYMYAVYNLGGDNLINFAPDNPNASPPPPNAKTYWADLRVAFGINNFVAGVVQSTGDQGTNSSYQVIKGAETFTLADLQHLKTPYGRQYLAWAMQYGTLWGLS